MRLLDELKERGLFHQITDESLGDLLEKEKFTVYCGFDPTADSLHIGNLLPLYTLRRFQKAGHKVIVVAGGATAMVGDPSGKSQERNLVDREKITQNLVGVKKELSHIVDLAGDNPAIIVNNADWFEKFSFLDFLREVGKHFTVNHMVAKESVRARLQDRDQGISFTEFSYMLLQAYDFYHLNREYGCRLQIGGSDQWGNITAGCELIRRMAFAQGRKADECFGLTFPLITKSDGSKFGKTEDGAVFMNSSRTSPYQLYQFFVQSADADVMNFLGYFTELDSGERKALADSVKKEPEKRVAQKKLAEAMTLLIHGEDELKKVQNASGALFEKSLSDLDGDTLLQAMEGAPRTQFGKDRVSGDGASVIDLLVETGLCKSKGAARRDLQGGGIYVNNERVESVEASVASSQLIDSKYLVLRKGKKNHHLIEFS